MSDLVRVERLIREQVRAGCTLWASQHLHEDLGVFLAEFDRLRAALELEVSRRTLGGTPPLPDQNWANQALPPPPSASDPTAAPHRRVGMARSDDHLR